MNEDADGAPPDPSTSKTTLPLQLVRQLLGAVIETEGDPSNGEVGPNWRSAIERFRDIKPSGPIESMLAAQMIAAHEAAMECLRRAIFEDKSLQGRDLNLKHAAKLMGIYERQVAALDKHRGRGQQNVTVKYVHVAEGGQAIVGNVTGSRAAEIPKTETPPTLQAPSEMPLGVQPARQKVRGRR